MPTYTRRALLAGVGPAVLFPKLALSESGRKPMRGAFPIMATPYTESNAVDYEDLAREVDFMDRCGVQGMVWPQSASEYTKLTKEERMKGMEILAKAAKGRKPALVLGVQGANTEEMLEYARLAEKLEPDAVIAIPPAEGKNLEDFRTYYRTLCWTARRPVFIQTSAGPRDVVPTTEFIVELARQFPNFGYVKEELDPLIPRMLEMSKHRPVIKALFSGSGGWPYEMRLGFDGMMPGAPYSDIYAQLWELNEAGQPRKVRELFSKLLLMTTLERQIPGMRLYIMKRRGVFKTMVSRRSEFKPEPKAIAEIEENFELLKPYLRA
ncbi:MAG: dihydrodipicolinate synthase family protein [Bryobacterales bacterium]|nr:dihydrodipicolinate synthase family protein [Bryobacterales bacterium]